MRDRAGLATRAVLSRTAQRYVVCDRFTRHYVASKLRMDPVHEALLALAVAAPFGGVLDLGCGRGQVGVALLEAGHATSVLALDQNAAGLQQLALAASGLALRTQCVDLAEWQDGEAADTVLLIDVLYQFASEAQIALLRRAARSAGRVIIVRASDPARGWRSVVSACLERRLLINATHGTVLRLLPALNLSDEQIDEGCEILSEVLRGMAP